LQFGSSLQKLRLQKLGRYGDADPTNVSPLVHGAEMLVAETRAVNRVLSFLVSSQHERYHNDYVPADHTDVKQVHHPQAPADSQHQEHSNHLAEHNTAHAAEVDG